MPTTPATTPTTTPTTAVDQVDVRGPRFAAWITTAVLAAVLRKGLFIRYGCKSGGCGTCKIHVIEGDVEEAHLSFALSNSERDEGIFLACSSIPLEDCVIDVRLRDKTGWTFMGIVQTFDVSLGINAAVANTVGGQIDGEVHFYKTAAP